MHLYSEGVYITPNDTELDANGSELYCLRQWHYYGCGLSAATTEFSSASVSPSFLLCVCVCVCVCVGMSVGV